MRKLFRFVVIAVVVGSPALFAGCGPSKITSDEIPTDIGDVSEEEEEDANPPEDE